MCSKGKLLFFLLFGGLNLATYSSSKHDGLISSLREQVQQKQDDLNVLIKDLKKANLVSLKNDNDKLKGFDYHPTFVQTTLLYGQQKYLNLASLAKCRYTLFFQSGLIKPWAKSLSFIPVKKDLQVLLVPKQDIIKQINKDSCPQNLKLSKDFSLENFEDTFKLIKLETPTNQKQCNQIINQWKNKPELAYLCAIPEKIAKGNRAERIIKSNKNLSIEVLRKLNIDKKEGLYLRDQITPYEQSYLTSLCHGIETPQTFCSPYLTLDAWSETINGSLDPWPMNALCSGILKQKAPLEKKQLTACAQKMRQDPLLCTKRSKTRGVFPHPNCDSLSDAYLDGSFSLNHQDCPSSIYNGHFSTTHRLLSYFNSQELQGNQSSADQCRSVTYQSLYQLYQDSKNAENWPYQMCYLDRIEGETICKNYIPGQSKHKISEESVVTDILYRLGKIGRHTKCHITTERRYNPAFIKYKSGCHIISYQKRCSYQNCSNKIIINEKEFDLITYKSLTPFNFKTSKWQLENKTLTYILRDQLDLTEKRIMNLTQLESFLKRKEKKSIYGVACLENIYPERFLQTQLNQCTPISFIVSAIVKENHNKKVLILTSIDDVYTPQFIPWNWLFNGIMNYKTKHPLNQWSLYGLFKK